MQGHEDLIVAARKLAKAHLKGEQQVENVKVSFDERYNEDQIVQALAGAFLRGEVIPLVETDRTGFYWFKSRA